MTYKNTQIGYYLYIIMMAIVGFFLVLLVQSSFNPALAIMMGFIVFILFSFSSLTVEVDEEYVSLRFGYGIYSRDIALDDIDSVEIVRNKWYYGFGIKFWFWPRMIIYNIAGLDAIEIILYNGKIIRIGTNDPVKLSYSISSQI